MSIQPFDAASFINFVRQQTKVPAENFARTEKLGVAWGFASLVPALRLTYTLLEDLASLPLENLSAHIKGRITPITQELHELCKNVEEFDSVDTPDNPNPRERREDILKRADALAQQAFDVFSPLIAYLKTTSAAQGEDTLSREQTAHEARQILESLRQQADATRSEKEKILKDAKGILDSARATSAKIGVSEHSVHFRKEADSHQKASRLWLRATIALTIFAFVLSALSLWHSLCMPGTFPGSLSATVSKLALLAVAYYAVIWAAKTYRSERHNAVINRHRSNALQSFTTFVDGSRDDATKDAVLLRATESIFSHQPSGYSDKAQESGNPHVLEVFRSLSGRTQE